MWEMWETKQSFWTNEISGEIYFLSYKPRTVQNSCLELVASDWGTLRGTIKCFDGDSRRPRWLTVSLWALLLASPESGLSLETHNNHHSTFNNHVVHFILWFSNVLRCSFVSQYTCFSPVSVRAHLHNAPGAGLLSFLQLVVYGQLSRLQAHTCTHSRMHTHTHACTHTHTHTHACTHTTHTYTQS